MPDIDALDQLHLELRQLQEDVSDAGYTRYHAPDDGYDDSVDSFALAASALDKLTAAHQRHGDNAGDDNSGITHI